MPSATQWGTLLTWAVSAAAFVAVWTFGVVWGWRVLRQLFTWLDGAEGRRIRARLRNTGWDVSCRWQPWGRHGWCASMTRTEPQQPTSRPGVTSATQHRWSVHADSYVEAWRMLARVVSAVEADRSQPPEEER